MKTLPIFGVSLMQSQFLPEETANALPQITQTESLLEEEEVVEAEFDQVAVTKLLTTTQAKIRQRKRKFVTTFILLELVMMVYGGLIIALSNTGNLSAMFAIMIGFAITTILGLIGFLWTLMHPLEFDVEQLVREGGVQAIGSLIDAMHSGVSPRRYRTIFTALSQLLPQLKASDTHLLTPAYRRRLNGLLSMERYDYTLNKDSLEFKLAILKAYEQVGDLSSLSVIEKLAKMRGWSKRACVLREAAQECLPHLRDRAADMTLTQTLLRGSQSEPAEKDALLRPAIENAATPAQELLRAAE